MRSSKKGRLDKKVKKTCDVRFLPFDICVKVPQGATILDASRKAGLLLKSSCGGKGICGDCLVEILSGAYEQRPSAALPDLVSKKGFALACQTIIKDRLTIQLPQFQQVSIQSVSSSQFFEDHKDNISGIYEVNPLVKKIKLTLPSPTLEFHYSDLERVQRELQKKLVINHLNCEYSVLKKLAHTVRKEEGQVSVVLFKSGEAWTVIDIEPANKEKKIYGIACDIGTTTVALHLVDLENGKILETRTSLNQQIKRGDDIISRINYAQKPGYLKELHDLITLTINHLIEQAAQSAHLLPSDIYLASFTGNTTMIHLFLNLEPRYIREEPYIPTFQELSFLKSRDLRLKMNDEARVHCAPAVGSYVGGDITAGLLCTPLVRDSEKISLFIDVGTNGELVVGNKDWLMTCACSAGPAFEGRGIKCGMPAVAGAIEEIRFKDGNELRYKVINSQQPKGLCGSGLVDLLGELFIHHYIDRNGKFNLKKPTQRFIRNENGMGFLIEKASDCYWGKDLIITENDIANLVRTKAAVFSACSLLLKKVELTFDKVDAFYIAGSFGQHLNIQNAIRIGLLPDLERNKFHYLGNSSLLGSYLILLSDKNREMAKDISKKMTYVELNTDPHYMNEYMSALFLPHTDIQLFPSVKKIFNK